MTAFRRIAAAVLIASTAGLAFADTKSIGKYPCDPHPVPKLPPIILPPFTKFPPVAPKAPAPAAPKPAVAKVTKGK